MADTKYIPCTYCMQPFTGKMLKLKEINEKIVKCCLALAVFKMHNGIIKNAGGTTNFATHADSTVKEKSSEHQTNIASITS